MQLCAALIDFLELEALVDPEAVWLAQNANGSPMVSG